MGKFEQPVPKNFKIIAAAFQLVLIFLYVGFAEYSENASAKVTPDLLQTGEAQITQSYPEFMDVHVMIFIGFGYLMTFLKKYGFGAVSLNYMVAAVAFEWGIIIEGLMHHVFEGTFGDKIGLDVGSAFSGDFAAATVLITYGGLLGKISPTQLLVICIIEVFFYALNAQILLNTLGVADVGGTMVIHMFGAYFGLACSWACSPKKSMTSDKNGSVVTSDLFSMIGAVFLFVFWPSFVGALASGNARNRAMLNTLLCIMSSTISAFFSSQWMRGGKFDMVDVQNATLAGGVTIGAIADMNLGPAAAMGVGVAAGLVSCYGYVAVQPWLEKKYGLTDTCGINNLHGMPSILGALFSVLGAFNATTKNYGSADGIATVFAAMQDEETGLITRTSENQALRQVAGLVITLAISIVTGLITGFLVKKKIFEPISVENDFFEDAYAFGVPDEYVCGVSNGDVEAGDSETFSPMTSVEMAPSRKTPPGTPPTNAKVESTLAHPQANIL